MLRYARKAMSRLLRRLSTLRPATTVASSREVRTPEPVAAPAPAPVVPTSTPSSPPAPSRPEVATRPIDWRTVAASDTDQHPELVNRLLDRSIDGVTVTGVFTPDECATAIEALRREQWGEIFWGEYIGLALGMLTPDDVDRSRYYDDAAEAQRVKLATFGFDPHERLADVLRPAWSGGPIVAPAEDGRPYNPGQVRYWAPDQGGLRAHVGNEFRRALATYAMKHLITTTSVTDHLSYFIVMQRASVGGQLSVYDLTWEEDAAEEFENLPVRDDSIFDDHPGRLIVDAGPGDLVLFGGGWRWHRVEPPSGEVPRITYGGFCAPSVDDNELHFWA